jgi:uncharacterized membrane protein YbhN (UPF0104 family)
MTKDQTAGKTKKAVRFLKLFLKILVTVACFWYLSTKLNFTSAWNALGSANIAWLLPAFLLFIISKIISAYRLNLYFLPAGVKLSAVKNMKLYWLGMFYNLFLPGAISGDAYKVILLNKHYKASFKKLSAAVLLDRISGVLALGCILAAYGFFLPALQDLRVLLAAGALLAIAGYYLLLHFLFPYFMEGFFPTLLMGFAVQLAQVIAIYCLMQSLDIPFVRHEWIFIFLASAVISILPLSLGGGLGTRELVFAEGARFFGLNPINGVVISLLFYLVTVAGSLPGLIYQFKDPLSEEDKTKAASF